MAIAKYWRAIVTAILVVLGVVVKDIVDACMSTSLSAVALNQLNGGDAAYAAEHAASGLPQLVSVIITLVVIAIIVAIWAPVVKRYIDKN
jgi:uncharacterized membrane protein YhaH (DUF805 family)